MLAEVAGRGAVSLVLGEMKVENGSVNSDISMNCGIIQLKIDVKHFTRGDFRCLALMRSYARCAIGILYVIKLSNSQVTFTPFARITLSVCMLANSKLRTKIGRQWFHCFKLVDL